MAENICNFLKGINGKKPESWKQLYKDYYSPLCRYAMRILNNEESAADIVQSVIIKLWENHFFFENIAALNVYLYRAVNNNCLKQIREWNAEDKRLKEWIFYTEDVTTESLPAVITEEVIRKLRSVIGHMPPKRQEVILLNLKNINNEEIAKMLGISINTIKKHKKEAYSTIRKELKNDLFLLSLFLCSTGYFLH